MVVLCGVWATNGRVGRYRNSQLSISFELKVTIVERERTEVKMSGKKGAKGAKGGGQVERARSLHKSAVYDVRCTKGEQLVSWRAIPLKFASCEDRKSRIRTLAPGAAESRAVRALRHPHLLRHVRTLPAPEVDALYLITEPLPDRTLSMLTQTAVSDRLIFREEFLWRILHQLGSACKALQHLQLQFFTKRFHPDHIYVDSNAVIKVDPFSVTNLEQNVFLSCKNDICTIGTILNNVISQTEQSPENFQNVLNQLLHNVEPSSECQILPDIILHHPTVLFNLDDSNDIFSQREHQSKRANDSAFESDNSSLKIEFSLPSINSSVVSKSRDSMTMQENVSLRIVESIENINLSPTVLALDLKIPGYVPRKPPRMKKWNSRSDLIKEPKDVSEETLNRVWLERLTDLQKREEAVKLKEKEIAKKNIFDKIWAEIPALNDSKKIQNDSSECIPGITLQSVMTEKIFTNTDLQKPSKTILSEKNQSKPMPKKPYHRSNSLKNKSKKKNLHVYEDMDSSLSADPGDTSILPTSKKLSAEIVQRPSGMENLSRRKVHFNSRNNPFAEYETVSSTTLTFFEIEDIDDTYEIPRKMSGKPEDISEKIAKFSYFDLEAMTNKKRAQMEEWKKTPPKPLLKSNLKVFTTDNQPLSDMTMKKPDTVTLRKSRRQKYLSPTLEKYSSTSHVNYYSSQSENSCKSIMSLPCITRLDSRRKSMGLTSNNRQESNESTIALSDNQKNKLSTRASFYCTRSSNAAKKIIDNVKSVRQTKKETTFPVEESANKENSCTPVSVKNKGRRSILGFKTPFKFKF
ncbi:uncharacterized protein LOC143917390 [Arctopsyche grandis]|uniref:uncharacterized protein LOC143917390 n=1 Tax=Arctopsyche grandis TaxID=121162 RepID=UPI00406DA38D